MGVVFSRLLQTVKLQRDAFVWMDFNDRATGDAAILGAEAAEASEPAGGATPDLEQRLLGLGTDRLGVRITPQVKRLIKSK